MARASTASSWWPSHRVPPPTTSWPWCAASRVCGGSATAAPSIRSPWACCRCSWATPRAWWSTTSPTRRPTAPPWSSGRAPRPTTSTVELTPGETPAPSREVVEVALAAFRGRITQVPPDHSAVHVEGRRAYQLAREGERPQLTPREVTIHALELTEWDASDPERPLAVLEVRCSAGTYVRSLARDLGGHLGCGAYLGALTRTASGPFRLDDAHALDHVREVLAAGDTASLLLPMDAGLEAIPELRVGARDREALGRGQVVRAREPGSGAATAPLVPAEPEAPAGAPGAGSSPRRRQSPRHRRSPRPRPPRRRAASCASGTSPADCWPWATSGPGACTLTRCSSPPKPEHADHPQPRPAARRYAPRGDGGRLRRGPPRPPAGVPRPRPDGAAARRPCRWR